MRDFGTACDAVTVITVLCSEEGVPLQRALCNKRGCNVAAITYVSGNRSTRDVSRISLGKAAAGCKPR